MAKKKLTERLRAKIKADYSKLKESDFDGEALTYLRRVRGAAKSRKIKKDETLKIEGLKIPKNSELYQKIEGVASMKGQSVAKWIKNKKNKAAVLLLFKNGGITVDRESEYLIGDIRKMPKKAKVFWNEEEVTKVYAISLIMEIQASSAQFSNIVMIRYEVRWDLMGNLHITHVPSREEIDEAISDMDSYDDSDDSMAMAWEEFLKKYEAINFIKS